MMSKLSVPLLVVVLLSQVVLGQDKPAIPKGPPPRFITVMSVDQAKGEVLFDVQVVVSGIPVINQPTLLVYPDGHRQLTLGTNPSYIHLGQGFKVSLKNSKWSGTDGKDIDTEAAAKRLKPGVIILLSADGTAVDRAYLRMFKEDTLVLFVAVEELPVPYYPHVGGTIRTIPIKKVGERSGPARITE